MYHQLSAGAAGRRLQLARPSQAENKTLLYSRNYHSTAEDHEEEEEEEEEEKKKEEVMMRPRVPSCPELEQETEFSVVGGGEVVVEGQPLTSDLYCLDRNLLWYCTSAIPR